MLSSFKLVDKMNYIKLIWSWQLQWSSAHMLAHPYIAIDANTMNATVSMTASGWFLQMCLIAFFILLAIVSLLFS